MADDTDTRRAQHDVPEATYRTPKGAEKQLDYILVIRKYLRWSKDAEANDTIHMESDHRSVIAQFVIPA